MVIQSTSTLLDLTKQTFLIIHYLPDTMLDTREEKMSNTWPCLWKADLTLLESKEEYKLIHIERQKQFSKWSFGMHCLQDRLTALESFWFYKQLCLRHSLPSSDFFSQFLLLLLDGNRIWILYQIFLDWLPACCLCLWFLNLEDSSFKLFLF